ncbi:U32 family peptidase [Actinomadura madurae]|uniref:U32 family peptidase n=1 Tax=Actinomadura madurae TaxID=1993 RepID=UPI0020270FDA|nr:U32 family peptidase [Actinomadura madurae]MCP9952674.1 U32 family peptidase [Actinomadura madurae]MCP9969441.1 U32 family peptidase [Actinomadura madurae]MCP9981900.1 U32 family peptidase [Actinomadura madurae]URM98181.1 U32 family peptidase [Actinomadura madurae]URN08868.1 U32 family peptidase [Actinomadura madurae]
MNNPARPENRTNGAGLLRAQGLPESDDYGRTRSPLRFGDGGDYRLEISGVERLSTLEVLIAESARHGVHIHRIVSFGGGATLLDRGELKAFAQLAAEHDIEVVACPGPRSGWDSGRQALTEEGVTTGKRVRGADNLRRLLDDYLRIFSVGLRGVLVVDEGVLDVLHHAREAGDLPPDAFFKVSVYAGHANPASVRILERLGADSVNPVGDLSLPMLAAIRSQVRIPLDVWALTFDSFGGMNRLWEAAEIAAVAAPVYFKIEPGESESVMYNGYTDPAYHEMLIRHKVRHAAILTELSETVDPTVLASPAPQAAMPEPVP